MDLGLDGAVALVTGGASGIGEAIARTLSGEGATVVIADKDRLRGSHLAEELHGLGRRARFVELDLTDEFAVRTMIDAIATEFGSLNVLVNNAAVNDCVGLTAETEQFRKSLERNLVSVYTVTRLCIPLLRQSHGAIVNIGSKVAVTGQGGTSGYAASKGALNALTREWAVDLLDDGIRVNLVAPAEVRTPMYEEWLRSAFEDSASALRAKESLIPLGNRLTDPAEVADMVAFLASARASHVTGQIVFVDGGYTHLDRSIRNTS